MILYIQALGFSEYDTREKAEALVSDIIEEPTTRYISNYAKDHIKVEYYKEYGKGFGLLVRGVLNEEEELNVYSLIPYATGSLQTDTHEIDVTKVNDRDVYSAYCEESKSGTPISFYLQNVIDYLDIEEKQKVYIDGVRLTAYCVEGTVILPIEKEEDEEELEIEEEVDAIREALLDEARKGDEEAMDMLEEEVIEASEILQERLKSEDILSILEGFFVPIDESEDVYSILGEIIKIDHYVNSFSKEKIVRLELKCMNLLMDIYVNEESLIGKPMLGMRFKGTGWMHGLIDFHFDDDEPFETIKDEIKEEDDQDE